MEEGGRHTTQPPIYVHALGDIDETAGRLGVPPSMNPGSQTSPKNYSQ